MGFTDLEDVHIEDDVTVSAMWFEPVNGDGSATVEHLNLVWLGASLVQEKDS